MTTTGSVMTVRGPVSGEDLGITLMHEHLIAAHYDYSTRGFAAGFEDVEIMIDEVRALQSAGGNTLVEVTPRGVGRDVRKLNQISEATGLHVVAGTAFYHEVAYPPEVFSSTIIELADLMTRELTEGIDGTDIKAGIIGEIGTGKGFVSAAEERVFRAAGRAQRRTGVAITTHTYWGGELAFDQIEILMDEGVPANRIIIGHLGDLRQCDYFADIACRGVYIQIDHIGFQRILPDHARAATVKELIDRGFGSQILLSMDVCWKEHLHYYGGYGYDHLLTSFVPELRRMGVTDNQIEDMLIHNTRRVLCNLS